MAEAAEVVIHPDEFELQAEDALSAGFFDDEAHEETQLAALSEWLRVEINLAESARGPQEQVWQDNMRMYEGVSAQRRRSFPFENASNLEVTLGAIATDAIYAQMLNLAFNISPFLTVREIGEEGKFTEHVEALQRFTEGIAANQLDIRRAAEHSILDDVKLGTGIFYIRWAERHRKTMVETISSVSPVVRSLPLEDFFVPGGSYDDLQNERWVAMRMWLTENQLNLRARDLGWDVEGLQPIGNVDQVRTMRERLGRHDGFGSRHTTGSDTGGGLFEIFDAYVHFDLDGDGIEEDLLVTFERKSGRILRWRFNPYDHRPFEAMRFQIRAHTFYGIGTMEMLRPMQQAATDLLRNMLDNSQLANTRFWVVRHGAIPGNNLRIWPNRTLPVADPHNDVVPHQMADIYPSAGQTFQQVLSLAEKRVGINDITSSRPSNIAGSRTPGITALAMLQRSSERFGPAFDGVRQGVANAVKQGLWRYQERLLADDQNAVNIINKMMGEQRGALVIALLKDRDFDDNVAIELTATSVQTNAESERQAWMTLLQALLPIWERVFSLSQLIDSGQVGPVAIETAKKLVEAVSQVTERALRTFKEVRDPSQFVININEEIDQTQGLNQQGLNELAAFFGQGGDDGSGAAGAGVEGASPAGLGGASGL